MASPFSGGAGRRAAQAVTASLVESQDEMDQRTHYGRKHSLAELEGGYNHALASNTTAFNLYKPYAATGLNAFNQYADASGVNGQEGHDRAVENFRAGPGYQWQVDQATDAVARRASSLGALGSGNTMTAITDRASNLADQEYDDYLGRLDNIGKTGFAATGAQAGIMTDRANMWQAKGRDRANVYQHEADTLVGTRQNTGQQIAEAVQGGMMAGQNAAANRWNMGMNLLNMGANFAGKIFG